jgi:predicted nucleic acid-binding protein
VTTCEAVIAEVLFVLCSPRQYKLSHADASARLYPLLTLQSLHLADRRVYLRALDIFAGASFLDFEDALIAAHMEDRGIPELLSYDTDFDRVPSVTRQEP